LIILKGSLKNQTAGHAVPFEISTGKPAVEE
jgi:hypothetical protein